MNGTLTGSLESSEVQPSSAKMIDIDVRGQIYTVAFLVDGKHVVSAGHEGKIRRWRVKDGMEVGTPMDAGSTVYNIAVSRDGKWIVSRTLGLVQVWSAKSGEKVNEFKGHSHLVNAVDVSPDSTKIATGSRDGTWKHDNWVVAVKFSPDGRFVATATRSSISIYDSQSGNLVVNVPIKVSFQTTTPSPGQAIANTSLPYLPARSSVWTHPLVQHFFNGPFTVTNTVALHWRATAHSSQPLSGHQSRSGMLRHTSKSDLSSSIQLEPGAWPSRQTTTL